MLALRVKGAELKFPVSTKTGQGQEVQAREGTIACQGKGVGALSPICVFDVNETLLDLRALDLYLRKPLVLLLLVKNGFLRCSNWRLSQPTITGEYRDLGALGATVVLFQRFMHIVLP